MKNTDPIIRLIAFFQRDLELVDEIRFAGCIISFMDVGDNAGPAAEQLIDDGSCLTASFHCITQTDYLDSELL